MSRLINDIGAFLTARGFEYSIQNRGGFDIIYAVTMNEGHTRMILPLEVRSETIEEAVVNSRKAEEAVRMICSEEGYPIVITEDRWNRQREMMQERLLAHLEVFSQAYARNCEVRRIEKEAARSFLAANHSYGDAACKYRYGLFLKRHTGHIAKEMEETSSDRARDNIGCLIAVATFSNARKWIKEGREIRSYEWVRYASLPGLRVSGGMGKLLGTFIKEVQPDDIMSYADLEWSEGRVYDMLGFVEEEKKEAVGFEIDPADWRRTALKGPAVKDGTDSQHTFIPGSAGKLYFVNFGSRKMRRKITEYK